MLARLAPRHLGADPFPARRRRRRTRPAPRPPPPGSRPRTAPRARRRASSPATTTARSWTGTACRRLPARSSTRRGRRSASTAAIGGSRRASAEGSGSPPPEPLYALSTDARTNTVVVGPRVLARAHARFGTRTALRACQPGDRQAPLPLSSGRCDGRGDRSRIPAPARRAGLRRGSGPGRSSLRRRRRGRFRVGHVRRCGLVWRTVVVAFSFGDLADLALAVFLVAVGLGISWAFLRLAVTFDRLSSLIRGTERDVLPVITKVGGSGRPDQFSTRQARHRDGQRCRCGRGSGRSGSRGQLRRQAPGPEDRRLLGGVLARVGVVQVAPQLGRRGRGGKGRGAAPGARSRRRAEGDA